MTQLSPSGLPLSLLKHNLSCYVIFTDYECVSENLYSTTNYTCKDYITSEESTTKSVPDSGISERMLPEYVIGIIAICTVVVFCALIFICCKKCRLCRNRPPPTNNEGTSKSKDSDPVQETGSVMLEMSSHIKGDESKDEQPSTADNYLETDVLIKMLPSVKMDKLEDEVTYKQPLTDHSLDMLL